MLDFPFYPNKKSICINVVANAYASGHKGPFETVSQILSALNIYLMALIMLPFHNPAQKAPASDFLLY